MKRIIVFITLLTLLNCMKNKTYSNDADFSELQATLKINSAEASNVYDDKFEDNFKIKIDSSFLKHYQKLIFIEEGNYYVGYYSKLDKRGQENPNLKYLCKIDSNTGDLTVVK